jgi:hypothetical protein
MVAIRAAQEHRNLTEGDYGPPIALAAFVPFRCREGGTRTSERDERTDEIAPGIAKTIRAIPLDGARLGASRRVRGAMFGEPLLAHPAEMGGIHAT